ncbi:conserved exported protein of unknown function [Rhodovastum atsumiense]|uniref:TIGR03016 family PEP-CTERM system-associated outer membrane protein n=1 Tax=Rhodovastum atsumiense TaxID=504468 RepID=A0A5M6IK84_9PROT|nr:TIGR03016 family PEP-CTERM system-associated outer membrane protein [Rhodovastum atsumiense]KAA5608660.1 TIGR03016 family PEP-CTERM system-associated outer membrane protein [Rhodovastum atsumiense]CAH2598818.1 conserved exported protein of unknown function [Rhodovastum atsumiense]
MPQVIWCPLRGVLLAALSWPAVGLAQPMGLQQDMMQPGVLQPMGSAQTGIGAGRAGLRQQVEGLFKAPADESALTEGNAPDEEGEAEKKIAPAWQISPSIGLAGAWTDAAPAGGGKARDSWIGVFEPTLLVNANADRIRGTINLAPTLQYYTNVSGQNGFDNNFDANAHLILWPEHAFIDLQGFGVVQSTLGGVGPSGTTILNRQSANQTYSFAATPYLREQFGDILTAEIGTRLSYTSQDPLSKTLSTTAASSNSYEYMNSLREFMVLALGPAFGRTSAALTASATQMDGTGVSQNAHRNTILLDLGYGITRSFTVLATTGYEDIAYHTVPPYRVNEGVWRGGFRWAPKPDSSVIVTYGRQYGVTALRLDSSYAVTERLRFYARYSEDVTSALQDLQDAVNSSILDPFGNPVDPVTGAPLLLSNNFFGSQLNNVLYRTTNGSVSAALLFDRDTIALTGTYRRQKPIGFAPNSGPRFNFAPGRDLLGSIRWEHDVNSNLRLNTFLEYGTRSGTNSTKAGDTNLFVGSVSVTYALSDATRLRLQYSYSNEPTGLSKGVTNIVTVGIRNDL